MTRRISDWRELPFEEIWCVDTEFYPGLGFDHGGRAGDLPTPLCLVACEMRSGRTIELWQDELGLNAPYRFDSKTLITGYMLAAEFGSILGSAGGNRLARSTRTLNFEC